MGKRRRGTYLSAMLTGVCVLLSLAVLSCTKGGQMDLMSASIRFLNPSAQIYTNTSAYSFQFQMDSNNAGITLTQATFNLYEGAGCSTNQWLGSFPISITGVTATSTPVYTLIDGHTYSGSVSVNSIFQSNCSSSIGVDMQAPNVVVFTFPTGNILTGLTQSLFTWSAATDNGISGLADTPYKVSLYSQANCGGTAVTSVTSTDPQYTFTSLTSGTTYSAQVSVLDKAGNESAKTCSSSVQIDTMIPSFQLSDATSSNGYSRVLNPAVTIDNDSTAASWCFTPNLAFTPTACTDACPSGTGTSNGWYTSEPTTLALAAGDGLKSFNLWICDSGGNLITHNLATGAITLDQTPPGNFTVTGIGGTSDTLFDAYWTSSGQPEVKWSASTDAISYTAQITDSTGATTLCSQSGLTVIDYTFTSCPVLVDGTTYKIKVTSLDTALNPTSAPDFSFTVDRTPPGTFSITGITGGLDVTADHWLGTSNPGINYSSASASTHYRVVVKDSGGTVVCTLGTKADQSGLFDYNVETGVSCSALIDGQSYNAYASAFDDGENETAASNDGYSFTIDTDPPNLSITPVAANTDDSFINVSFSASDMGSGMGSYKCRIDGGAYATCTSPANYTGLISGSHEVDIKAKDIAGNTSTQSVTWNRYGYSWITSGFSGCTATQPAWSAGGFGACSAAQPAYTYGSYGSCSATCGGGTQTRTQTCPINSGTQTQTVTCPVNSGTETQTVQCQRSDSTIVADTFCDAPSKPATSESCTRGGGTDCSGTAPSTTQACSRGGGSDCNSAQATSQSCNTGPCGPYWVDQGPPSIPGGSCSAYLGFSPTAGTNCTGYNGITCVSDLGHQVICQ